MSIIMLENVSKSYNKKVLDNISIDIKEGELVAITGESGRGKSTLLNIIGLLEYPDEGKLIIDGEVNVKPSSMKANKILRNKISYLFQNFALIDEGSVYSNLMLSLKYNSCSKSEKKEKIKNALNKVGLENYEKRKIYELSGGEQQRVAIARVILKPSKIILADEPTGSLDEKNRDQVISLLKYLNKEGKTVVIVTHDKNVANECDRIIEL